MTNLGAMRPAPLSSFGAVCARGEGSRFPPRAGQARFSLYAPVRQILLGGFGG